MPPPDRTQNPATVRYSGRMNTATAPVIRLRAGLLGSALLLGLATIALPAHARPYWMQGATSGSDAEFLPPDAAFRVGAHLDGDQLHVRWIIADGYYLYRQKIQVAPESADLILGPVQLPPGEPLNDAYFGTQQVYRGSVEAVVPVTRQDFGAHPVQVRVSYQGCAEAGLCYPLLARVLFPAEPDAARAPPAHPPQRWEALAIGGGTLGFLLAGLYLRRGRTLRAGTR